MKPSEIARTDCCWRPARLLRHPTRVLPAAWHQRQFTALLAVEEQETSFVEVAFGNGTVFRLRKP